MSTVKILPADIFSTEGNGILGWANYKLTCTPKGTHTKQYHYGIVGDPVFNDEGVQVDFETRESISKGPALQRLLAQHAGKHIELYRIPGITQEERDRMVRAISIVGMKPYGYSDFLQAAVDVLRLIIIKRKLPPYNPSDFLASRNEEYICTELAAFAAAYISKRLEPPDEPDLWDIPALYEQAVEEFRLSRYYSGPMTKNLIFDY